MTVCQANYIFHEENSLVTYIFHLIITNETMIGVLDWSLLLESIIPKFDIESMYEYLPKYQ